MKKIIQSTAIIFSLTLSLLGFNKAFAADYTVDTSGMHAGIMFKISHLGYSWMYGRFNDFEGSFSYDETDPSNSEVAISVQTASVDTNNAERDKHLRSSDFLNVNQHPEATFTSTGYQPNNSGGGLLSGDLTLNGVTRAIDIEVDKIGQGNDPWGNYRAGFEGITSIALRDFNITTDLGPASASLDLIISLEGIRN